MASPIGKINRQQNLFVQEYLKDLNATQAAIRAGYSQRSAEVLGADLLKKPWVAAAVDEALLIRKQNNEITQEKILRELAYIAFSDVTNVTQFGPNGMDLKDSNTLPEAHRRAIAEVSETVSPGGGSRKFKHHDKLKALELLGKHLSMFKERVEVTGKDGGPIEQTQLSREERLERISQLKGKFDQVDE